MIPGWKVRVTPPCGWSVNYSGCRGHYILKPPRSHPTSLLSPHPTSIIHCATVLVVCLLMFGLALKKFLWLIKFEIRTGAACLWDIIYSIRVPYTIYLCVPFVRRIKCLCSAHRWEIWSSQVDFLFRISITFKWHIIC